MTGRLLSCNVSALAWSRTAYRQANANLVWYNCYRTLYALRFAHRSPKPTPTAMLSGLLRTPQVGAWHALTLPEDGRGSGPTQNKSRLVRIHPDQAAQVGSRPNPHRAHH